MHVRLQKEKHRRYASSLLTVSLLLGSTSSYVIVDKDNSPKQKHHHPFFPRRGLAPLPTTIRHDATRTTTNRRGLYMVSTNNNNNKGSNIHDEYYDPSAVFPAYNNTHGAEDYDWILDQLDEASDEFFEQQQQQQAPTLQQPKQVKQDAYNSILDQLDEACDEFFQEQQAQQAQQTPQEAQEAQPVNPKDPSIFVPSKKTKEQKESETLLNQLDQASDEFFQLQQQQQQKQQQEQEVQQQQQLEQGKQEVQQVRKEEKQEEPKVQEQKQPQMIVGVPKMTDEQEGEALEISDIEQEQLASVLGGFLVGACLVGGGVVHEHGTLQLTMQALFGLAGAFATYAVVYDDEKEIEAPLVRQILGGTLSAVSKIALSAGGFLSKKGFQALPDLVLFVVVFLPMQVIQMIVSLLASLMQDPAKEMSRAMKEKVDELAMFPQRKFQESLENIMAWRPQQNNNKLHQEATEEDKNNIVTDTPPPQQEVQQHDIISDTIVTAPQRMLEQWVNAARSNMEQIPAMISQNIQDTFVTKPKDIMVAQLKEIQAAPERAFQQTAETIQNLSSEFDQARKTVYKETTETLQNVTSQLFFAPKEETTADPVPPSPTLPNAILDQIDRIASGELLSFDSNNNPTQLLETLNQLDQASDKLSAAAKNKVQQKKENNNWILHQIEQAKNTTTANFVSMKKMVDGKATKHNPEDSMNARKTKGEVKDSTTMSKKIDVKPQQKQPIMPNQKNWIIDQLEQATIQFQQNNIDETKKKNDDEPQKAQKLQITRHETKDTDAAATTATSDDTSKKFTDNKVRTTFQGLVNQFEQASSAFFPKKKSKGDPQTKNAWFMKENNNNEMIPTKRLDATFSGSRSNYTTTTTTATTTKKQIVDKRKDETKNNKLPKTPKEPTKTKQTTNWIPNQLFKQAPQELFSQWNKSFLARKDKTKNAPKTTKENNDQNVKTKNKPFFATTAVEKGPSPKTNKKKNDQTIRTKNKPFFATTLLDNSDASQPQEAKEVSQLPKKSSTIRITKTSMKKYNNTNDNNDGDEDDDTTNDNNNKNKVRATFRILNHLESVLSPKRKMNLTTTTDIPSSNSTSTTQP